MIANSNSVILLTLLMSMVIVNSAAKLELFDILSKNQSKK